MLLPYATAKKNIIPSTIPNSHQGPKFGLYGFTVRLLAAVVVAAAGVLVGLARDHERRHGVGPPQAEQGVRPEADEQGGGQVRAQHVLLALALGGGGAQLLAYSPL